MRTIKNLTEFPYGSYRVYVYLKDEQTGKKFLEQAEAEGYTFCDGEKPTNREFSFVMAVNEDMTINYVGANGYIAFSSNAPFVGSKRLMRVDYAKYAAGENDYEYKKT